MKKGQVINGYEILENPSTAGMSQWTFAKKGGTTYFIKKFLRPTYPLDAGSTARKEDKRKECSIFEERNRKLYEVLREKTGTGGNLITPHQFFRDQAHYYKVTVRVDTSGLTPLEVSKLELSDRLLVLTTAAHSLRILHSVGIVHGDIKPDNILIGRSDSGDVIAKLIDFDDSYFSGEPPSPENTVGDQKYYSPELMEYIAESGKVKPSDLQTASDIFALGLVFAEYLTGKMPDFAPYPYAHLAVINGQDLQVALSDLPSELIGLINRMLVNKYTERPTINSIFEEIRDVRFGLLGKTVPIRKPPTPDPSIPDSDKKGSKLSVSRNLQDARSSGEHETESTKKPKGVLRGTGLKKKE